MTPIRLPAAMTKASKYGAKKTTVDGIVFDSKAEAARWVKLEQLQRLGQVADLRRQVPIELVPGVKLHGASGVLQRNGAAHERFQTGLGHLRIEEQTTSAAPVADLQGIEHRPQQPPQVNACVGTHRDYRTEWRSAPRVIGCAPSRQRRQTPPATPAS